MPEEPHGRQEAKARGIGRGYGEHGYQEQAPNCCLQLGPPPAFCIHPSHHHEFIGTLSHSLGQSPQGLNNTEDALQTPETGLGAFFPLCHSLVLLFVCGKDFHSVVHAGLVLTGQFRGP